MNIVIFGKYILCTIFGSLLAKFSNSLILPCIFKHAHG